MPLPKHDAFDDCTRKLAVAFDAMMRLERAPADLAAYAMLLTLASQILGRALVLVAPPGEHADTLSAIQASLRGAHAEQ